MTAMDGPRVMLDWSSQGPAGAASVGEPKPCRFCSRPALLRDPVTGTPTHKVCAEADLTARAEANGARG